MKYWTILLIYTLSQHLDHYLDWHPDGYAVNTWSLTGRSSWSWWIVGQLYPLRVSTNSWSWMPLVNMIWTSSVFNNTFFRMYPRYLYLPCHPPRPSWSIHFNMNSCSDHVTQRFMCIPRKYKWLMGYCMVYTTQNHYIVKIKTESPV